MNSQPLLRTIPFRAMNSPTRRASVIGKCATWHCVCGNPVALQGRSGPATGPTPDSVVSCPECGRVYFVIPQDRSHGPPVEVVELFGMPGEDVPPAPPKPASPPASAAVSRAPEPPDVSSASL